MQITRQSLTAWEAAPGLTAWFDTAFPAGSGDYQAVLDALAAADRPKDAHWLMDAAGPDLGAVLVVDELTGRHCFAAGRMVVRGAVDLAGELRAGGAVRADGDLRAGGSIEAGGAILAEGDIGARGHLSAAGDLRADGDLWAGGAILAGGYIEAGGDLRAGGNIWTDGDLRAGGVIVANGDIICPTRPEKIASGTWRAPEAEAELETEDSPSP